MGCNCGGNARLPRPPMQSLAADGRKVLWYVGTVPYETIQEAKVASDASGEPIRRVFASQQ